MILRSAAVFFISMLSMNSVFASEAVGSSSDSAPATQAPLRKSRSAQKMERPLTAVNFFEPIMDKYPRPKSWPEKLTFQPETGKTYEELQKEMQGTWRMSFACSGRPLTADVLKKRSAFGFYKASGISRDIPFLKVHLEKNNQVKRIIGGSIHELHDSSLLKAERKIEDYEYQASPNASGSIFVEFKGLLDMEMFPVHILETEEKAFLIKEKYKDEESKIFCRPGEEFQVIYTRDSEFIVDLRNGFHLLKLAEL